MTATERRTLRCMFEIGQPLAQKPLNWTVTDIGGVIQWFCVFTTVSNLLRDGMVSTVGDTVVLTVAGDAQAAGDPIVWDGYC